MTRHRSERRPGRGPSQPAAEGEILHMTAMRSTKYGSVEQYFVALANGCSKRGWRLVLQYNETPRSSRYVDDLHEAGGTLIVRRLGGGQVVAAIRAIGLIAQRRPRIVHLHFCGAVTRMGVGLLAHRLGVASTVMTAHFVPNPLSRAFARASYARIDRIYCVSHSVEQALASMGVSDSALTTAYLGVPDRGPLPATTRGDVRQQLAIPSTSPVLATIVFNNPLKGVDVLVDAFIDYLAPSFPNLHLIVVGVPPSECTLASGRTGCSPDRLHWVGIQDDVRPFLAAADIYVQPSRMEGLGLAILEAMSQSLPVVATNVGGIPEAVADGESGFLVEPNAARDLAAAISKLLADPDTARRFAAAGNALWRRKFEQMRSVDRMVGEYCAALDPDHCAVRRDRSP